MRAIKFIFLFTYIVNSQVSQEWVARYHYQDTDWGISMAVDLNNNIYVLGISGGIDWDYATVKYNSSGVQQWVARYNGPGNYTDYAYSIAVNNTGDVYVTGWSYFGTGTHGDWATIKYNSSGLQQWVARYNGPANWDDGAYAMVVDQNNYIYVTGNDVGLTGGWDYATVKYNSDGIQQWIARYNGPANGTDVATSIAYDMSGNIYVTGYSSGIGTSSDYATLKYNSYGIQQWVTRYNGPLSSEDAAKSISLDQSGNIFVTGSSYGIGSGRDYLTIKYNPSGILQWSVRYNGTSNDDDFTSSLVVDANGNAIITGQSKSNAAGYDYVTIKYNAFGVQQWLARYNGPGNGNDEPYSMTRDDLNNIYITGRSQGVNTDYDYATIKYNSAGIQQWVIRYNDTNNSYDRANSIVVDSYRNVYVTGNERNDYDDFATVKYSQSIGIQPISNEIPDKFYLSQNYPNPFNPITHFEFAIKNTEFVSLKISDLLGKEIAVLVNEKLNPGIYQIDWDGTNVPGGVYFYTLQANEFKDTKKMILIK